MKLVDYMCSTKAKISGRIERELQIFSTECKGRGTELAYVFPSLIGYSLSGKMLRGALVCLGSALFRTTEMCSTADHRAIAEPSDAALDIATAMELFQSGLLIHDDIMDKDDTRRGQPTMHRLFERHETAGTNSFALRADATTADASTRTGAHNKSQNAEIAHLGESLGICAGDICYFIAWKLITKHSSEIGALVSRELVDVCLAQMRDVRVGCFSEFPSLEEILDIYSYKTARYTITMPLCCGALLEKHPEALPQIEELGINLGILFQLQDDYLGLFGNESELGKPVGSDLKEGKKTPFMILLQPKLTPAEAIRFSSVFGNEYLDLEDMDFIRGLVRNYSVDLAVRKLSETYARKAHAALEALEKADTPIALDMFRLLSEFIEYSLARTF